ASGRRSRWPSARTRIAGPRTGEPISFIRTNLSNVPAFRSYRRAAIAARFLLLFLWSMWGKVMVIFPSSSPDCRFVRRRGQRWLPLVALMLLWLDASAAGESLPIHHNDFNASQRDIPARAARMGDGRVGPAQDPQDGLPMLLAQAQEPKAPNAAKP